MKAKMFFSVLLTTMVFIFSSCGDDKDDLDTPVGGNLKKGVHKIEVTVTSQSSEITTVLSYAGIGKDGINANASLYNESGEKCGDGSYVRSIEEGTGKFVCYTNADATGLMCSVGVVCHEEGSSASVVAVAYINDKEVSKIEKTFRKNQTDIFSIQTFSQD